MHEWLELHDSTLGEIRRDGDDVVILLAPAYVHRSPGDPGRDAGTGWSANVIVRIRNAVPPPSRDDLPQDIGDGRLIIGNRILENGFPLPFVTDQPVRLELDLSFGKSLEFAGTAMTAEPAGDYVYVEDFEPPPSGRKEVELVVAFVDLTKFEAQGRLTGARELADAMDAYYEIVGAAVEKAGGTLVKFIGDAALMVFVPERINDAVEMLLLLKWTVDAFFKELEWECRLTARVHVGSVIAGPFGARGAKRYDVIGGTVNATARLKSAGVVVSREVFERLRDDLRASVAEA